MIFYAKIRIIISKGKYYQPTIYSIGDDDFQVTVTVFMILSPALPGMGLVSLIIAYGRA